MQVKRVRDKNQLVLRIEVGALGSDQEFNETHKMRYFFQPELCLFMQYTGRKPLNLVEWMTDHGVSPETAPPLLLNGMHRSSH